MNSARNQNIHFENQDNVGGMENVPPTFCLPAAYASANAPAYVGRTGKAGNENLMGTVSTGHLAEDSLIRPMEPSP